MAMRRGGTGAGGGGTTQILAIGPVQKMVLLSAEKGRGAPVRRWRPERSPRVMVSANVIPAMDDGRKHRMPMEAEAFKRHALLGDAEGPELHGKNHRTGHGDGPYRLPRGSHY